MYRTIFLVTAVAMIVVTLLQLNNSNKERQRAETEHQQEQQQAHRAEVDMVGKLGTANGKLDAIAKFQEQFIDFVGKHQPAGTDSVAVSKAYQSMAQAILKLPTPVQPSLSLVHCHRLLLMLLPVVER